MTEHIIRVDVDEALKLAEAAQAMLAALYEIVESNRSWTGLCWTYNRAGTIARAAIAQAEAAGIKTGEEV